MPTVALSRYDRDWMRKVCERDPEAVKPWRNSKVLALLNENVELLDKLHATAWAFDRIAEAEQTERSTSETARKMIAELREKLAQAEAKSAMSMASEAAAWSQRDEAVNLATLLRDERDLFADQRDALRQEVRDTDDALERTNHVNDQLRQQVGRVEVERDALRAQLDDVTTDNLLAEAQDEITDLRVERDALRAPIERVRTVIEYPAAMGFGYTHKGVMYVKLDQIRAALAGDGRVDVLDKLYDAAAVEDAELIDRLASDGRDDPEDIAESREWARSRRDAQRRAQESVVSDARRTGDDDE